MAVVIVLAGGLGWLLRLDPRGAPPSPDGATGAIPPNAERLKMSRSAKIRHLERYGRVPEDADLSDWQLAMGTSWWGKRIDPKDFWTGRVVWLDEEAMLAARRRGRMYPPIPQDHASNWSTRGDDQDVDNSTSYEIEGPNIRYHVSNREAKFWDMFQKSQPKPPLDLQREQFDLAERILRARYEFEHGNPRRETARRLAESESMQRRRASELGGPAEAFSDEAIYWAYVKRKKEEFKKLADSGRSTNSAPFRTFFFGLAVEANHVSSPLRADEIRAANAWKVDYLQRLRREKADECYINAYLKAWNLSREVVFGETQK